MREVCDIGYICIIEYPNVCYLNDQSTTHVVTVEVEEHPTTRR